MGRSEALLILLLDWMLGTLGVVDIELRELLPPINQSELIIQSCDLCGLIRAQYSGHVILVDQSEVSIQVT